jgi:hypothetical protein
MTDATLPSLNQNPTSRPRRRMTPKDARLRTIRVKTMRVVFLAGAVASILALAGTAIIRATQPKANFDSAVVKGENLVLDAPRFVGRTKSGGRIVVTAEKAVRSMSNNTGAVQLEKPVLQTDDGSTATANTGIWSPDPQTLSLDGNVKLTRQAGDVATSATANWVSDPASLTMNGNVVMTRENGDNVEGTNAVWQSNPAQLSVSGDVIIVRATGARASGGTAVWRSDQSVLELRQAVRITLPSGEGASAQRARFDDRFGNLTLEGQAVVRFNSGQATSSRAYYQGATGRVTGEGGIQINSSLGNGSADRYVYETRSKRLNMSGNARVTLR